MGRPWLQPRLPGAQLIHLPHLFLTLLTHRCSASKPDATQLQGSSPHVATGDFWCTSYAYSYQSLTCVPEARGQWFTHTGRLSFSRESAGWGHPRPAQSGSQTANPSDLAPSTRFPAPGSYSLTRWSLLCVHVSSSFDSAVLRVCFPLFLSFPPFPTSPPSRTWTEPLGRARSHLPPPTGFIMIVIRKNLRP